MQSRKTVTILTSPSTPSKSLPGLANVGSPGNRQSAVYRIEERSRTIYVASDTNPAEWDAHSLNTIFSVADASEEDPSAPTVTIPVRRSKSLVETEVILATDANSPSGLGRASSRLSMHGSRHTLMHPTSPKSSSNPPSPRSWRLSNAFRSVLPRRRILFYHKEDPYYGFTNFSPHPVVYKGKRYPTSEHLFQSFKFQDHRPGLAEHIRTCSERPSVAFSEARRFSPEVRSDWKDVSIDKMDETLFHKFTQHADLRDELLGTGEAELIEDSDKDSFWGWGADKQGRNELGKCLERLRTVLRGDGPGN